MTVIRPNSISGINSITANGGDINLFRADGTKADVPIVNNITAGVVTATKFVGPIEGNVTGGTINAASATITGNLGVAGTLTYEDVTNIDSVGVITARGGIKIGATGANTLIGGNATGIGIGIAAPTSKLYVNGVSTNDIITARAADTNGTSVINILAEGTTGHSRIKFSDTAGTDGQISYTHTDRALTFAASGTTEKVRIQNGGLRMNGGAYIMEVTGGSGAPNNANRQMDQRRWLWYGTSSTTHTVARVAKASSGQPGDGDSQLAAWIVTYTARSMYGFNSDGGYSVMKMRTGRFDYNDNEVRFSTEQDTLGTGGGSQNPTIVFTDEGSGVVRISITNPSSTHSFGEINLMTYDCRITLPTG